MIIPINAVNINNVANVQIWIQHGTSSAIGSSFNTVSGQISSQLQSSTNTTLGYFNGQMLAFSAGNGTGIYAGQTAGAVINFDPNSTDTGQAIWNGWIICDASLHQPFPINTTTPVGSTVLIATPSTEWIIRQQFLYAGGTPATDVTAVNTAVIAFSKVTRLPAISNPSGSTEQIFAY